MLSIQVEVVRKFYDLLQLLVRQKWFTVEAKISALEKKLKEKPEFSVELVLEGNDKLTRFYTGMSTYKYLEPRALQLRIWRGSETSTNSNTKGIQLHAVCA